MTMPMSPSPSVRSAAPAPATARRPQRVRDFGVGYGRSSGYVRQARYTSNAFSTRFRLG